MDFTGTIWTHLACVALGILVTVPIVAYFVKRFSYAQGYFAGLGDIEDMAKTQPQELMRLLFGYAIVPLSEEQVKVLEEFENDNDSTSED